MDHSADRAAELSRKADRGVGCGPGDPHHFNVVHPDISDPSELHLDDTHRVLVEDLALYLRVRRQAPDSGEDLRSETLFAFAKRVGAIAAEHQLILVTLEELAGLILIAEHGVQPGTGGKVAVHIGIIG